MRADLHILCKLTSTFLLILIHERFLTLLKILLKYLNALFKHFPSLNIFFTIIKVMTVILQCNRFRPTKQMYKLKLKIF